MLPAGFRLRRRADFTATLRGARGRRGNGLVVVHVHTRDELPDRPRGEPFDQASDKQASGSSTGHRAAARPVRVGFVVSRAVGPAVTRNLVKRRLRHVLARRLADLPAGSQVVVRALPASAGASSDQLDAALTRALALRGPR